jgi:pyruvate dehydrogenase E2 component (dihydrolipoamide acetyltransferase)
MASRVVMPKLSDTMEEGLIIKWHKQEGDRVESGDAIAEIETDKAVMDLEAYASGVMRKILVPAETKVSAGALIAVIAREDEDISEILKEPTPSPAARKAPAHSVGPTSPKTQTMGRPAGVHPAFTPRASRMAAEAGLDPTILRGSGPDGLITERDVKAALEKQGQAETDSELTELSPMRRAIARRMTQSKQTTPHFYVTIEIAMDRTLELKNRLEKDGCKVSVTDILTRAAALTLREFPKINASYIGEKVCNYQKIHIGLAVGLEEGILTPVIRDADQKTVAQIATESRKLIERAKTRKITPEEYTGSTFSLSNLGMFDVDNFIAIIQPGEGAVLAVGSIKEVAVITDGKVTSGRHMKVTLSCDHRVIDGLQAAQFLQGFKRRLEQEELG